MLIPIQSNDENELPLWAMIEMQGELEWKSTLKAEGKGLDVGVFTSSKEADTVHLTIGHHQLEGQVVPLKKPLAVLQKQIESCSEDLDETMEPQKDCKICYKLVGVVRDKYHFKSRPRALITKPETAMT